MCAAALLGLAGGCGKSYHNFHARFNGYYHARQRYREAVKQRQQTFVPPAEGFMPLVDAPGTQAVLAAGDSAGQALANQLAQQQRAGVVPGGGFGQAQPGGAAQLSGFGQPGGYSPGQGGLGQTQTGYNQPGLVQAQAGVVGTPTPYGQPTGTYAPSQGAYGTSLPQASGGVAGSFPNTSGGGSYGTSVSPVGGGGAGFASGAGSGGFGGVPGGGINPAYNPNADPATLYPNDPTVKGDLLQQTIQKCELLIFRRPKSNWVDDAHLLIAKALYQQGNYARALSTLEYTESKFAKSELIPEVQLWKAKIQYQYANAEGARQLLDRALKGRASLSRGAQAEAALLFAQLLVAQGNLSRAIQVVEDNRRSLRSKMDRARSHFLLAQLYERSNVLPRAWDNYDAVIRLDQNDAMTFRARMAQVALLPRYRPAKVRDKPADILDDMAATGRYAAYRPQIYVTKGRLEAERKQTPAAERAYRQALAAAAQHPDPLAQTQAYHALGRIYFYQQHRPGQAAAYYDSAATTAPEGYAQRAELLRMRDALDEYRTYTAEVHRQDSLLALSGMTDAQLDAHIREAMEVEAERAEAAAAARAEAEERRAQVEANQPPPALGPSAGGTFYFASPALVARGAPEFKRVWGERPNVDYWRYAALARRAFAGADNAGSAATAPAGGVATPQGTQSRAERIAARKAEVPRGPQARQDAQQKLQEAQFALAQVYGERLDMPDSAQALLRALIARDPRSQMAQRSHYALYRMLRQRKPNEAQLHAQTLLRDFAASEYARLIRNEGKTGAVIEANDFESAYTALYGLFQAGDYATVHSFAAYLRSTYADHPDIPRLLFLDGAAYGRQRQLDSMKVVFGQLIQRYPDSEAAQTAQLTLTRLAQDPRTFLASPEESAAAELPPDERQAAEAAIARAAEDPAATPLPDKQPFAVSLGRDERIQALLFFPTDALSAEEARNLVSRFTAQHFSKAKLDAGVYTVQGQHLVFVGPFNDYVAGKAYLDKLLADRNLRRLLPDPAQQAVLASSTNFRLSLTGRRFAEYAAFYQQQLPAWLKR